jgi:hypothetical protein
MRHHWTTARGALFLLLLTAIGLAASGTSSALNDPGAQPPTGSQPIVFPIAGPANYSDDYGAPRAQGHHEGNDILTTWRSPAVAAEDGKVKFWTTSARAGCMLYLYGASGTTYLYIHLNNDLTARRDNRGKCVAGVAYATGLKDGAQVRAGQQIGYNGDSGDAEGTYHLHFEVHPKNGDAVDPFPFLNEATRLLFPLPAKGTRQVTLGLKGTPLTAGGGVLELSVTAVRVWPGGAWTTVVAHPVQLAVPQDALLDRSVAAQIVAPTRSVLSAKSATPLVVFTRPVKPTLDVTTGMPGTISVDHILPA